LILHDDTRKTPLRKEDSGVKKILIGAVLLAALVQTAAASEKLVCISSGLFMGIRGGLEQRFDRDLGWRVDLGISPFGLVTSDAFFAVFLLPRESRWRVNLLFGIPSAAMILTFNAGMISVGGSCSVGIWVNDRISLDFRLGMGFPFFFEKGEPVIRDIGFPLDLWPDAAFSLNIRL